MSAAVPQGAVDGAVGAARAYLRIAGSGEDAVLGTLARAAFEVGEQFTGTRFVARAGETTPGAEPPREPVLAADWESLPAGIAHGLVMLVAHLFEARGRDTAPPAAVAALWRPYRRLRLAGPPSSRLGS